MSEPAPSAPSPRDSRESRDSLEARLRHAQKIEALGRLAAGIAHDFNNLLTVIQGHATLLRSDPSLNKAATESVLQIARAAERASQFTAQLLAFGRRRPMSPRPLALNELLTGLSELLRRTLGEDIQSQFSYASDLPDVLADPAMLEQVVVNLAVHAREAMPGGGQLLLSTSLAEIDARYVARHPGDARPGRFVCLTVTDTGTGVDQSTLGHIFEPFFTARESGKGGLSLATAYGLVRQHQGWIEALSQPGQGSSFKVFLPASDAATTSAADAKTAEPVPRGTETVLVVEDEAPVRWVIKDVLRQYGYNVLEAGNGIEALSLWHRQHGDIALLLTDMIMPIGLSGQELAERFTTQKPALKVMFISGYSLCVAGRDFAVMDGLNFLQKPFDGARLARAVRRCLDA